MAVHTCVEGRSGLVLEGEFLCRFALVVTMHQCIYFERMGVVAMVERHGVTLVELLVVIAIIAGYLVLVSPRRSG